MGLIRNRPQLFGALGVVVAIGGGAVLPVVLSAAGSAASVAPDGSASPLLSVRSMTWRTRSQRASAVASMVTNYFALGDRPPRRDRPKHDYRALVKM